MNFKLKKLRNNIIIIIILSLIAITMIYPLIFMIFNSFKSQPEYILSPLALPKSLFLVNYNTIYNSYKILKLFTNSFIIVSASIFIELFLCSLGAYAFSKHNFKFKNLTFLLIISMMIVPFQVLMLPLYVMFSKFQLINTKISLIIIYSAVMIPFALYYLTKSFRSIPNEVLEAAKMEGASYFRIYWAIILPIGKMAIITIFILDFVWLWNELVLSLIFLQSDETKTMVSGVATILNRYLNNQPLLLTGLLLSSIPTIIIYSFAAKYLIKGISSGAVKG